MNITCSYCGKERPWSYYGGVGPCNCEASVEARRIECERARRAEAERKIEEHKILHHKAISCDHEWAGGLNPAYTRCIKCGISLGNYYDHR